MKKPQTLKEVKEIMDLFEEFCIEYNLDYDFTKWSGQYESYHTAKAYIIFKYSANYRECS